MQVKKQNTDTREFFKKETFQVFETEVALQNGELILLQLKIVKRSKIFFRFLETSMKLS